MKPVILEPGDLVFTQGDAWLSKAIRWFTRSRGEGPTAANHVALSASRGTLCEAVIIEAVSTVSKGRLYSRYGPPGHDRVAIYRAYGLTSEVLERVVWKAESYEGARYSYALIGAHFGDWCLSRIRGKSVYFFRRLAGMRDYPICSWLVAHAFESEGYSFGVPADAAAPDDIWDWVTQDRSGWECIRPLARLPGIPI